MIQRNPSFGITQQQAGALSARQRWSSTNPSVILHWRYLVRLMLQVVLLSGGRAFQDSS